MTIANVQLAQSRNPDAGLHFLLWSCTAYSYSLVMALVTALSGQGVAELAWYFWAFPLAMTLLCSPLFFSRRLESFFIFALLSLFLPFALAIASPGHTEYSLRFTMVFRELTLLLLLVAAIIRARAQPFKFTGFDLALGGLLCWCLLSAIASEAPMIARLVSAREMGIFFCVYYLGRFSFHALDRGAPEYFFVGGKMIFLPLVLFTALTLWIGDDFWFRANIPQYFSLKFSNADFSVLLEESILPPNFYTYIAGARLPRQVGPILDAPGFSRFLSFFFILFFARISLRFVRKQKASLMDIAILLLIIGCQLLSLGRGGVLVDVIGVCLVLVHISGARLFGIVLFILATAVVIYFSTSGDPNTARHIEGLTNAFANISLTGQGLGTGGQQVSSYTATLTPNPHDVRESFVGSLIYQTGIIGSLLYLALGLQLLRMSLSFMLPAQHGQDCQAIWFAACGSTLGALITSMLANSAVSFYAILCPLFALGWVYEYMRKSGSEHAQS